MTNFTTYFKELKVMSQNRYRYPLDSSQDIYSFLLDNKTLTLIRTKFAKPDKLIIEHTDDTLEGAYLLFKLGYIELETYKLLCIVCVYHDLGKLIEEFQKRVKNPNLKFNGSIEIVHNILSAFFVDEDKFNSKYEYLVSLNAVINTHYYCDVPKTLREKSVLIEKLLSNFEHNKIKKTTISKMISISEDVDAIKIKGLLHKCDYSASAGVPIEFENDFLEETLYKVLDTWKQEDRSVQWNELQEFCLKNKDSNLIYVAQTTMDQTEADLLLTGLLWIGNSKGFFMLPLKTTTNDIYDRVKKYLNLNGMDTRNKLGLLHSGSLDYLLSHNDTNNSSIDTKENEELIIQEKIAKQLSLPLTICTIDQLFDFVFKYPTYELKLATLSYSKIVVYEIQMYSPDLLAYLIYGLERIANMGGKIAVLATTLPPFVQELLCKNILFTVSSQSFIDTTVRHNLKVLHKRLNAQDICNKFLENKKNNVNNKILVVCNSVTKAQKMHSEIKAKLGDSCLDMLHAKYVKFERLEKEQKILEFGKTYKEDSNTELDKQEGIWITTSIVEVGLNIDFDYIFTELQDLNSLFKRISICNRKGKKTVMTTNCFVYTTIDEWLFTNSEIDYIDKLMFDISKEALGLWNGSISEKQKVELINTYFTTEKLEGSSYMNKYFKAYSFIKTLPPNSFKSREVKLRNILSVDVIPKPIYDKFYEHITDIESKLQNFDQYINYFEKDNITPAIKRAERLKLENELKKYTVSVNPRFIPKIDCTNIKLNKHEYIRVVDCEYDELGFRKKKS